MPDITHRVHGLADDSVAPDWPALRAGEVARLLRCYPALGAPLSIRWHSPRPLSAAVLVDTDEGAVFVKRHHRLVRSVATLSEEHRFIAHLQTGGIPIPDLLAGMDGQTAIAIGDWVYEIHTVAEGIDLYRDAVSWSPIAERGHARAAGRMLATLHDAAASYTADQRDTHILVARSELLAAADPIAAFAQQLPDRPGLADYLRQRDWAADVQRVLAPWHDTLPQRVATQSALWTHNDWHVSNLCWSDAGPSACVRSVLDFGLSSRTFALFDLATAIERNAIAWLALEQGDGAVHADIARALIDGYREIRALSADDIQLLADLLPLVHVDFALSEVEYFHAVTGSRANADVAYDTFLLGHASWFATPHGQTLLQAIRALA
ncbi:phosphotransferase enzyme family protein [Rhodanobacter sp. BL-MT-08]